MLVVLSFFVIDMFDAKCFIDIWVCIFYYLFINSISGITNLSNVSTETIAGRTEADQANYVHSFQTVVVLGDRERKGREISGQGCCYVRIAWTTSPHEPARIVGIGPDLNTILEIGAVREPALFKSQAEKWPRLKICLDPELVPDLDAWSVARVLHQQRQRCRRGSQDFHSVHFLLKLSTLKVLKIVTHIYFSYSILTFKQFISTLEINVMSSL